MQKKILVTLLALCMLLAVLPFALTAGAADDECIEIDTADELLMLMNQQEGYSWSANYVLTADIDLTKKTVDLSQAPIGNATTAYSGTFDGDGHTIRGIAITSEGTDVGLFGMAIDATICDLTIEGTISGKDYTGGFVGFGKNLTITNCVNECTVTGSNYVGGIIGALGSSEKTVRNATASGTITGCRNKGEISGAHYVGGIVAYTRTTGTVTVSECMNESTVTATAAKSDVGGIAGIVWGVKNNGKVIVSDCINTSTIAGNTSCIGGIVGRAHEINDIQYCYNAGETTWTVETGSENVDAIVGSWTERTEDTTVATAVTGSYYTQGTTDTDCGGVLVTENIGVASSYADETNGALNTNYKWFFTEDGPVLERFVTEIADADSLYELMGKTVNGYYRLTCDIDLSKLEEDKTQSPIASFSGVFDGNGYTISGINLVVGTESSNGFGLFGNAKNAKIHNLTIEGTIDGEDLYMVGGIVGNGTLATGEYLYISGCTNKCMVTGGQYVGGIVGGIGYNAMVLGGKVPSKGTATITDCRNVGAISATTQAGGIAGMVYSSDTANVATHNITECLNIGSVTGTGADIGGILGIEWVASVYDSINIGTIKSGGINAGGIVGRSAGYANIKYCYNSGEVTANGADADRAHAIIGYVQSTNKSDFTGNYFSAGITDPKGTFVDDEKGNADTYTDWSADIWTFTSAGPRLTSYIVEIGTADEFIALTQNSDEWDDGNFYILTADINLKSVEGQTSIGNEATPFVGGFDGAGYTISGIYIEGAVEKVGLFGVAENAEFYELTIDGVVGGDQKYTGGLVGYGSNLYIENCTNRCTVTANAEHVGGIVGYLPVSTRSIIIGSRNDGSITGSRYVGGIVGQAYSGDTANPDTAHSISECMNTGAVKAESTSQSDAGGIVGVIRGAYVYNCINTDAISADSKNNYTGGIVGRAYGNNNSIRYCYNSGVSAGYSVIGTPNSAVDKFGNYYADDGKADSSYGTKVLAADLGDASKFTNLNTNGKWMLTDNGPALKRFTVEISAEVVATTEDTVTVELYAESGVPFWGVKFAINAGEGLTLATEDFAVETVGGFECVPSEDGTTAALLQMSVADSALAKTKIATLTFNVAKDATAIQDITVTVNEAYNSKRDVVDAYGDSTSISTILLDVTYGHGVVLYSEYVLEYTLNPGKYSWLEALEAENCYMLFESTDANGKTTATVVDAYEQSGKFRFSAPGIAAKNMGDEVKGTFFYEDAEGDRHYGYTDTYNLVDYYNAMYEKAANYDGLDTLLNAMLNYGATAEDYFEYATENSVGTSLPDGYVATGVVANEHTDLGTETGETIKYSAYGSTAVLNQRIELVVSFTLNTGAKAIDASELVFKGEYEDVKGTTRTFTISGNDFEVDAETNMITVYIDQIAAKDLRQMVTGALYQGDTQVSQSVTTSFECYATIADAAEKDICAAILAYVDAAKTYFTQPN